jgi:hypothetical protein
MMIKRPSFLNAGEFRMSGIHSLSHRFAETRPPGSPVMHGESWPSWQTFGVIHV